jgi:HD-GYP domain-containing protein (c-di-GMP phosphodiesterase class II)
MGRWGDGEVMRKYLRTHVDDLQLGMFIAELDRPWVETPFLIQGFTVDSTDELATLRELCKYVEVDLGLSRPLTEESRMVAHGGKKRVKIISKVFPDKTLITYEDAFVFEDEMGTADKVFNDYEKVISDLYQGVSATGRVDMASVTQTIHKVVGSIMRNPDACMFLSAIRDKDTYSYSHAISSSILAAALGRQVGLSVPDIKTLATGVVLCDVGKLDVPSSILNKDSPLSDSEIIAVREHVACGLSILDKSAGVSKEVIAIVANHHERYNGSGYPKGLSRDQIPPFSRIAGIVDCYDAITSDRAYANGISPADAISKLYTMRNVDFQSELVEEFIQSVGIYPVGSLVELTDGRIGVVATEHRRRRLRPRLLVIRGCDKQPAAQGEYVNMLDETEDRMGRPLEILRGVDPNEYAVNADDLFF